MDTGKRKGKIRQYNTVPWNNKIESNCGDTTIIKRIEAWDSESILGVRCGLDGSDDIELQYRIQEAQTLAGRIKMAPLTRFDSDIVFRERWMATIKYCLPITRFTTEQCKQLSKIVKPDILPKLCFNRHMPKVVIYGPKQFGGKQLMNIHTEQTIMHTETFLAHLRGEDDIGTLQRILLIKMQLVVGAKDFLFQSDANRYPYCKHNEVSFLLQQLSSLQITLDIQGAWKPALRDLKDMFIMEAFIDKGYSSTVLTVLNDIHVYMRVLVLSDISINNGKQISNWALRSEVHSSHK